MRKLFEEVWDNSKAIIKMNVFLVKNSKRKVFKKYRLWDIVLKSIIVIFDQLVTESCVLNGYLFKDISPKFGW